MFLIEKDGEQQFVDSLAGYDGWTVLREGPGACDDLPRDPCWSDAAQAFVSHGARIADAEASPAHIHKMHAVKQAEALFHLFIADTLLPRIKDAVPALDMTGLVIAGGAIAEEAAMLGITPRALAEQVLAAAGADRAREVARRQAKEQFRADHPDT